MRLLSLGEDARRAGMTAVLSLGYVASLAASVRISGGGVPPFWLCNAFVAALVLLVSDRRLLVLSIGFCALAGYGVMLLSFPHASVAFLRSACNMVEGGLAGWLALGVLGPRRLLRSASGFLSLQVLAVLPAVLVNWLMREVSLRTFTDPHLAMTWRGAFLPHFLGMAIMLPALLMLFQPTMAELKRRWSEVALILGGVGLVTHLIFNVANMPAAFIISPLMLLTAFRLGPRGSIFGHLVVGLVCLPETLHGGGAFSLTPQWDLNARALVWQMILLSSVFGVSFCAFVVADQARMRRLLELRAVSARDARRRALIASRAKTDFLATMSHEIRTPMNSILGFTQLLMHNPGVSRTAREQVKVISEAGGSLMTVLNDILDFSKVEAGQIELHLEALDIGAVAEGAAQILREPALAKGLVLRVETEGLKGRYRGDGQRLRQVLLNLLNNAVKFTDRGHILLRVTRVAERGVLRFEVSDTGIGIEEDVIGRLFTRFSQADSSTTRHYGGSGLGLAICKGLVERMEGAIGVDSRLGEGSMFWFEVPAVADAAFAETSDPIGSARPLRGRVLLVDDHPMNRRLGETLLGLLGCEVHVAASGEEAVQAARDQVYDAILMDVHMPRMDGLQATRAIRQLAGPSGDTPIIAMSADVMPQSQERCRQAGMVDHLAKPVQMQTLHEVLERWMSVQQKRRSAA